MNQVCKPHGRITGIVCGLGAAATFGMSTPLAKLLLPELGSLALAGLLYVGAGVALLVVGLVRRPAAAEARLRRADIPYLAGIIVAGGILGPLLMLHGLGRVSAIAGSLLLNLEAPLTILVAVAFFGAHLGLRAGTAAALIIGGSAALSWRPGDIHADWVGALAIAAACACWAIDNNLTQRLSLRNPVAVVRVKALGAGACTLGSAVAIGQPLPGVGVIAPALLLGAVSYGLSILLDAYALRLLGAAREAACFATAPFVGALAAIPILGERLAVIDVAAMAIMAAGIALMVRERHQHVHAHEEMEHDHLHVHDEHHQHAHDGPFTEPHSHPHRHAPLVHDHPHVPDLHHRHRH